MKKYIIAVHYTESTSAVSEFPVYANNADDARLAARMQFLDRRRDNPVIDDVRINDSTDEKTS